jgi:DNA-directed RNA polymerase beta' subunit
MTETQQKHLANIVDQATSRLIDKYQKGAREHQSTLSEDYTKEQLLEEAISEAIDQVVYLLTLREKLHE